MRIVYLHQYFNTPSMPGGIRSYAMARRLVMSGHEVHMVTSDRKPDQSARKNWYETKEEGIQVHWFPVPYFNRMEYGARIRAFLRFSLAAAGKAASLEADVVFATSTPLTIALPAAYAARRRKIPMVFEVRDLWPELPIAIGALRNPVAVHLARWLERFAYRNASWIVALSPGMKAGIIAAGYPEGRVTLIPNCCDLELFDVSPERGAGFRQRHPWLRDRPLALYAGALATMNGIDYLVRLAACVKKLDPEIRFLVVGEGKEEERVRQSAVSTQVLGKTFFMMPPVSKNEITEFLSAATIATSLFIDLKEMQANSANKFFDALAAGRPIAINYGGWQAELLEETGAGIVLDVHDVEASARKMVAVIRDTDRLARAAAAARKLAIERFSADLLAGELERVLIGVV